MRVDQHWNRCQDRLKHHCLGIFPNFDWASWFNVEVSPALSRDLDNRPPNLLSPWNFSDFKEDAVVPSSVWESCGLKAEFGRVWMGVLAYISLLKPLGRALCVQGPMHSTRRAGLFTLPLTFSSDTHSHQGTCCEWAGNSQAHSCSCNLRISVRLWRYSLFPKRGGMPL